MKNCRWIAALLALILCLGMAPGLAEEPTDREPGASEITYAQDNTQAAPVIVLDENNAFENDKILFRITDIEEDEFWGTVFYVTMTNKTEGKLCFYTDTAVVNGMVCNVFLYEEVEAQDTVDSFFYLYELESYGVIGDVMSLDVYLRAYDPDNWEADSVFSGGLRLYPQGEAAAESATPFTPPEDALQLMATEDYSLSCLGYASDEYWGRQILLYFVNTSAMELQMYVSGAVVDGYLVEPYCSKSVPAGAALVCTASLGSLEELGLADPTRIDLMVTVQRNDGYQEAPLLDTTFTLYPQGEEAFVGYPERKPGEQDQILFNTEDAAMIFVGDTRDDVFGYSARFFLDNKTDRDLMFSLMDAQVNGQETTFFWAEKVPAGTRCYADMEWPTEYLAELDIQTVEQLMLHMTVYEWADWSAPELLDDGFTIQVSAPEAEEPLPEMTEETVENTEREDVP